LFTLRLFRVGAAAVLLATLGGCASVLSPEGDTLAGLLANGGRLAPPVIPAEPDLRYRYLRLELQGYPPALLVLGYVDAHPLGPVEVWYSAQREVLKTQHGRIVATVGLPVDWSGVRYAVAPPAWDAVPAQGVAYTRYRDQMPGYRYGIAEQLHLAPTLAPTLAPATAQGYQWFVERSAGGQLPDAWFAWGRHRGAWDVVYSHQCLSPDFCLRLQRWPVKE
jgi:Group 4 capsule polysaccharide lipoprotein gfcB, YjbF